MSGNEPSDGLRVRIPSERLSEPDSSIAGGQCPSHPARQAESSEECPRNDDLQHRRRDRYAFLPPSSSTLIPSDPAFVDRADVKEYVGYPPPQAVYWILTSCLKELMGKGLVREFALLRWRLVPVGTSKDEDREHKVCYSIKRLADKCYVSCSFWPAREWTEWRRVTTSPDDFFGVSRSSRTLGTSRVQDRRQAIQVAREVSSDGYVRWSLSSRTSGVQEGGYMTRTDIGEGDSTGRGE